MTAAKKIGKKAGKKSTKKQKPTPGTSTVKDRVVGVPLWREAHLVADYLRAYGVDPAKAIADINHAALSERQLVRSRNVGVPMWVLDWAVAILETIPRRSPRKRGKPRQDAVEDVRVLAHEGSKAEAARLIATLEARRTMQQRDGETEKEFRKRENLAIEDRSKLLARQASRGRKTDKP